MAKVDDIRVKVGWFHSRKCKRLQDRLGNEGVIALMQLWCWVATERSRGVLYEMDYQDIAAEAGWPEDDAEQFVDTLIELKLIDRGDEWLEIHQWSEHQEWAYETENRSEKARDNANKRWGSNANSNAKSKSSNAPILSSPILTLPIPSYPKKKSPIDRFNKWISGNAETIRAKWRNIDRKQYDQYQDKAFFSKADTEFIKREVGKMRNWIVDNPQKGNKKRWGSFVTTWLNGAYEKKQVTPIMTNQQEKDHYAKHRRSGPTKDFQGMGPTMIVTDQNGKPINTD